MSYKNEQWLREKYHDERKSMPEIAEICGVSYRTIYNWMERHGIERRSLEEANKLDALRSPASFTHERGYERWVTRNGDSRYRVRVHRLLAVAEFGFDAVCGMDVHHKNHIPWDNRPENLEIIGHAEHTARHHRESSCSDGSEMNDSEQFSGGLS